MNTVFIGGSRQVSRLPEEVTHRLDNVVRSGHRVVVGDASGADKAVQRYLHDAAYRSVTVFCSGDVCRNNLGQWPIHAVTGTQHLKGFQFYAAKDRVMAREADFGLMIWDGRSAGTILNVLRLARAGKKSVLYSVPENRAMTFKTAADWHEFLDRCPEALRRDLRERATPDEWQASGPPDLLDRPAVEHDEAVAGDPPSPVGVDRAAVLNTALATADPSAIVSALGILARSHGMTRVAKEAGLARESLYRALGADGNPEFSTVIKVLSSLGLRLSAIPAMPQDDAAE